MVVVLQPYVHAYIAGRAVAAYGPAPPEKGLASGPIGICGAYPFLGSIINCCLSHCAMRSVLSGAGIIRFIMHPDAIDDPVVEYSLDEALPVACGIWFSRKYGGDSLGSSGALALGDLL